jgi:hypothetical protein
MKQPDRLDRIVPIVFLNILPFLLTNSPIDDSKIALLLKNRDGGAMKKNGERSLFL